MAKETAEEKAPPSPKEWREIISLFENNSSRNNAMIRHYLDEMMRLGSIERIRAFSYQEEMNAILEQNQTPFFVESYRPKGMRQYHLRVVRN